MLAPAEHYDTHSAATAWTLRPRRCLTAVARTSVEKLPFTAPRGGDLDSHQMSGLCFFCLRSPRAAELAASTALTAPPVSVRVSVVDRLAAHFHSGSSGAFEPTAAVSGVTLPEFLATFKTPQAELRAAFKYCETEDAILASRGQLPPHAWIACAIWLRWHPTVR
jgi:hypothetical protein